MKVRMTRTGLGHEAGDVFEVGDLSGDKIFVDRDGELRLLAAIPYEIVPDETPEPCGLSVDVMVKRLRKAESLGGVLPCHLATNDDLHRLAENMMLAQRMIGGLTVVTADGKLRETTPDERKAILEIV